MPRRCWVLIVAMLLSSACISVDDFAAYWDKGFVDPALEGTWKKLAWPGVTLDNTPGPRHWRFVKRESSYVLLADDDKDPLETRSLRIGKGVFLMFRGSPGRHDDGILHRYEVQGTRLCEYLPDTNIVVPFLDAQHPTAKNIKGRSGQGAGIDIGTLDEEAFLVMAELTAKPEYWEKPMCNYVKQR